MIPRKELKADNFVKYYKELVPNESDLSSGTGSCVMVIHANVQCGQRSFKGVH
jgi:hypothetical protein